MNQDAAKAALLKKLAEQAMRQVRASVALRKWAVEHVIQSGNAGNVGDVTAEAQKLFDWLTTMPVELTPEAE